MDEQEVPAGHVFISYRHEDSASVDRLESRLVDAGIQVWRDKKDLWPGDHWSAVIRRAITDGTLVFLACFSSASLARPRSWQNEELSLAVEEMRLRPADEPWLIPIRFDNCDIPDIDIGAGRTLGSVQRSDLFGDNADAQAARLVAAIKRILRQPPEAPPLRRRWPVVVTVCGTLIIAAGAVVAVRELISPSPPRHSSSSAPKGSFAVPILGATVRARKQLHASGTADIQPGHKLELFLQFGDQAKYFAAGDPRTSIPLVKGRWHGEIYIGAAGTITLWLVDLPPNSVVLINKEVNYQNNGFPDITKLGKILASEQATATSATPALPRVLHDPGSTGVYAIAFSPGGSTLAVGDLNGGSYLWNMGTGNLTATFRSPKCQGVYGVAISRDGSKLAAATVNSTYTYGGACLWDVATHKLIGILHDPNGAGTTSVSFSPDSSTVATDGNSGAYLWNVATGKVTATLNDPGSQKGYAVAFSPAGGTLAVADGNGNVYLWSVATGRPTRTLFGPAGLAATSVAFSRDGTIITAGDANGKVYLWDVATGKLVRTFRSPGSQRVNGVTFSRNGTTIAATINGIHGKSSICLWDVATGHLIATLHDPHSEGAFPLEFNPDDSILAVGDANANTYLWKLSRFRPAE